MLRFSAAPHGDMHIGELRNALVAYLAARQKKERFVVRIEDADRERNVEGKEREILEIMELFGIRYDDVAYQSRNLTIHQHMAIKLLQERKAFACFCSPDTLEAARAEARKAGRPYRYSGRCERLPDAEVIDNPNPFTVRLRKPEHPVVFEELRKGEIRVEPDEIDAFVILRTDKSPTESFATAIDDMLQDISLVVSDEPLLSFARQTAVRRALGYDKKVACLQLPPLHPQEGEDRLPTVRELVEEGFLPEAIANALLEPFIEEGLKEGGGCFTPEEASALLSPDAIADAPIRFDRARLEALNGCHIRRADAKELSRAFGFADADVGELAKRFAKGACTLEEIRPHIRAIFSPKPFDGPQGERMRQLKAALADAPLFEDFGALAAHLSQKTGLQGEALETPLRLLLTGEESGPALSELYPHLKNYLQEIAK
jgi:glutamyl-tRNA synthetase